MVQAQFERNDAGCWMNVSTNKDFHFKYSLN